MERRNDALAIPYSAKSPQACGQLTFRPLIRMAWHPT